MAELSKEEIIEKNRQSVKKTAKRALIVFAVAVAILVGYSIYRTIKSHVPKPDVFFEVVSTQDYARDGKKCKGYRVYVKEKPSNKDARAIFNYVTNDRYYLHTVWFYTDKKAAEGTDGARWIMEQVSQGITPTID